MVFGGLVSVDVVLSIAEFLEVKLAGGVVRLKGVLQALIDVASTIAAKNHLSNLTINLFMLMNIAAPVLFINGYSATIRSK